MPLFRRRLEATEPPAFTVGVDGHRVVVGGRESGCMMLTELDDYLDAVGRYGRVLDDGRDSIALQNAKMDYVEMADAAVMIVTLAVEELTEQRVLDVTDIPEKPALGALDRDMPTYEYIQSTYARATQRVAWIRAVDAVLRRYDIAIVKPAAEG